MNNTQPAHIRTIGTARLTAMDGGENLVRFLEETLIPDLLASGSESTAEDFAACCVEIRRLAAERLRLSKKLDTIRAATCTA